MGHIPCGWAFAGLPADPSTTSNADEPNRVRNSGAGVTRFPHSPDRDRLWNFSAGDHGRAGANLLLGWRERRLGRSRRGSAAGSRVLIRSMAIRTIPLDSKNLESGIEALSSAMRAFQLTRLERVAYYALMASVNVAVWGGLTLFFVVLLSGKYELARGVPKALGTVAAGIMTFGAGLAAVALLLNIPLAYKLFRERARLKKLGLAPLSKSLWQESRRARWISRVARWAAGTIFVMLYLLATFNQVFRNGKWGSGELSVLLLLTLLLCCNSSLNTYVISASGLS
jgi:hypothetical protein